MMTLFPSALQWLPECFGTPINKPHTLTDEEGGTTYQNLGNMEHLTLNLLYRNLYERRGKSDNARPHPT
jgi:hypothetical protein